MILPSDATIISAVRDSTQHKVLVLCCELDDANILTNVAERSKVLATKALGDVFGEQAARQFLVKSENAWLLRTKFGGWLFFLPSEILTPETQMEELGDPDFVYWPTAEGVYGRVPWLQWQRDRSDGHTWRPDTKGKSSMGSGSIWDHLRSPKEL